MVVALRKQGEVASTRSNSYGETRAKYTWLTHSWAAFRHSWGSEPSV